MMTWSLVNFNVSVTKADQNLKLKGNLTLTRLTTFTLIVEKIRLLKLKRNILEPFCKNTVGSLRFLENVSPENGMTCCMFSAIKDTELLGRLKMVMTDRTAAMADYHTRLITALEKLCNRPLQW